MKRPGRKLLAAAAFTSDDDGSAIIARGQFDPPFQLQESKAGSNDIEPRSGLCRAFLQPQPSDRDLDLVCQRLKIRQAGVAVVSNMR